MHFDLHPLSQQARHNHQHTACARNTDKNTLRDTACTGSGYTHMLFQHTDTHCHTQTKWHRHRNNNTHPDTHNFHFFLSSPFQPLPFIITQPEARQHPVWLPFSTSYPRWTAIYHSAHRYQLPSLPQLVHFKGPIKAVSSGRTFTWDKDFILMFSRSPQKQQTTKITVLTLALIFIPKWVICRLKHVTPLSCKEITYLRRKRL